MFEQQYQMLAKVRANLSVLSGVDDAFDAALSSANLEPHLRTLLTEWRRPLRTFIAEQRTQETNLLRIID
jgi:hypothetical protein